MNEALPGFYSAQQLRELERAAGVPGYALMQRAAAACWRELTRRWPVANSFDVLCGPGNNGGDGYEIARLAANAGRSVTVWQAGSAPAEGDAARAAGEWRRAGGRTQAYAGGALGAEVVVDALFGIGLSRAPEGLARAAILAINAARDAGAGVLAVDVPSGLDAERGSAPGDAVRAHVTVTFIGHKAGLLTGSGPDHAGDVVFAGLEVPAEAYAAQRAAGAVLAPEWLRAALPRRARTAHKGANGHVLVVGGESGMAGAALLAGRAALRAGAGLVSVATRAGHAAALTAAQPELMCHGAEEPRALGPLLARASVLAVGPGFGRGEWSRRLVDVVLGAALPVVVDADGLNWLSENPARRDDWVLTPHPGEAARLLGCPTAEVQADRIAAARRLRERFGGVVVLKGAGSLVIGEHLALCPYGNPGMGTGGMGDVLCGLIAGLLAQGLGAETAARAGVLAHALAGDRAARAGQRGLLPGDLLPEFRTLLNP